MSTTRSFSFATFVQYAFLAVVGYILAGAPLGSLFTSSTTSNAGWSRASYGNSNSGISKEKLESLAIPDANLSCVERGFAGVYVLSRDPLVVYIEGFLGEDEVSHVVGLSEPLLTPSTVWTQGQERLDPTVRLSEKAQLPRDSTVQCIESRARSFQGWRPYLFIERLWTQKYGPGGHYTYHYDWSSAGRFAGRVSSFMVWLGDECTGGGTRFPRLERPKGEGWCRFIECAGEDGQEVEGDAREALEGNKDEGDIGITFKPIKGNAVFWENMRADGSGYEESWHAGLPVTRGTKIGLNIWSWYQEGYVPSESA